MGADQSTVARRVECSGIGLHGGANVAITLSPAEPDSGVVFVVYPNPDSSAVEIPARADAVLASSRATRLTARCGTTISTVEHLLAALYVVRIDNVRIEVKGTEIPVMDGSALPFLEWVRSAGRIVQSQPSVEFDVSRTFEIREGRRSIRIEPQATLAISYAIEFDHPSIGYQSLEFRSIDESVFASEIAAARTFGFEREIESLRAAGLARGGSFENALVLSEERVLNDSGLRWPDEFVRHKVIDLLGDLSLLGGRLNGHVHVEWGGHDLHHRFVDGLLEDKDLLIPVMGRCERAGPAQTAVLESLA